MQEEQGSVAMSPCRLWASSPHRHPLKREGRVRVHPRARPCCVSALRRRRPPLPQAPTSETRAAAPPQATLCSLPQCFLLKCFSEGLSILVVSKMTNYWLLIIFQKICYLKWLAFQCSEKWSPGMQWAFVQCVSVITGFGIRVHLLGGGELGFP